MNRQSLIHQSRKHSINKNHPWLKGIAMMATLTIPFSTIGIAYGDTVTNTTTNNTATSTPTAPAAPAPVTRIVQYPSGDNFYELMNGVFYHFIGPVGHPVASFPVGSAPSFVKPNTVYVRDVNHKFYERALDGDHLEGTYIPPYEALDLHIATPIKASEIDTYIAQISPTSPLVGYGQAFLDAQTKYGVNALYLVSHAILESAYGMSAIAEDKHNLFGYQAYDSDPYDNAAYFNTFNDSIDWQAYFVGKQYLSTTGDWYGGTANLDGMNVHYASDPYWAEKIAGIMNKIHPYNPSEYTNAKPLTATAGAPQGPVPDPVTSIINATTPLTASGITTDTVNFRSEPTTASDPMDVLQPNTPVNITGVSGNWYRVTMGSTNGWLFKDYVKLVNPSTPNRPTPAPAPVTPSPSPTPSQGSGSSSANTNPSTSIKPNGVITADDVNFRSQPSTSSSVQIYQVLKSGTPVTILTVTSDNWYKAQVGNQIGWIYRDYAKLANQSSNASKISVLINGEMQSYDPSPVIINGRTLVPMRAIFEHFGANVSWNGKTNTVTATKGSTTIVLTIGSNVAKLSGKTTQLDTAPLIANGRTIVPIRFISEALGANVQWDGLTQNIFITSNLV